MPLDAHRRPTRQPDFRLEEMGGELLLFHPARGRVLYCNQPAALIWRLCDGERTVSEIVELLAEAYPEAGDQVAEDVAAALEHFVSAHALDLV